MVTFKLAVMFGAISLPMTLCRACCAVHGPSGSVAFAGQTNLILWDKERGIEHFVRSASFRSEASNFGFIAPTPSKPELKEASSSVFRVLAALKPKQPRLPSLFAEAKTAATSKGVRVIQEVDVAGYHAVTLRASDAKSLRAWLNANGYVSPPEIEHWLAKYISQDWYLTAFRVAGGPRTSTGTIRMSFATKQPFNPYYVPAGNLTGPTPILLYFVAEGNYAATVGKTAAWQDPKWQAEVPDAAGDNIAAALKIPRDSLPASMHLATYEGQFDPSATDDIYFTPRSAIGWAEVLGLAAVGGMAALALRRAVLRARTA